MIEETIKSFEKEFEEEQSKINADNQRRKSHQIILQTLARKNYDIETTKNLLNENRFGTLSALLLATENREIDLKNDSGRRIWRIVYEYLGDRSLKKELSLVKRGLYIIGKPLTVGKACFIDSLAEGVEFFVMGMTLGTVPFYSVANRIRDNIFHKYTLEILYPFLYF